jgi:hypothetical protein
MKALVLLLVGTNVCGPSLGTISAACIPPASGLVSWWPGDGTAADIQDGNNGAVQSGATYAPGLVGQAFSFNGSGQYIQVPDAANLEFGTNSPITICLWAYRTNNNSIMHIVGKRTGCSAGNTFNYQMALDNSAGFGLEFGAANPNQVSTHVDLPLNTWWHLAGTFDGTTFRFYTNGVLAASAIGMLGPINSAPLRIGTSGDCASFAGQLDEVQLYNRALSVSEIQAIYAAGSAGVCKPAPTNCIASPFGQVSWWPGDGTASDIQGGNTGTLQNGATFSSGVVGQAFSFTNNHAGVVVGSPTNLQLQDFTIQTWIARGSAAFVSDDPTSFNGSAVVFCYGSQGYGLGLASDGTLFLTKIDVDSVFAGAKVTDTNFHHVAVTKSGSKVVFYVDGAAYPAASAYTDTFQFPAMASIGVRADNLNGNNNDSFFGVIDELSVFDRALSSNELAAIFNAGSAGMCKQTCVSAVSGLISWWPGDGTASDIQNGNNATLQSGATYAAGLVGQAFSFNGSGHYVQVPDAASLEFSTNSPITICLWAYRTNNNSIMHLVGKRSGCAAGPSINYQMALDNSAGYGLLFGGANISQVNTHVDLPLNAWWHLAGTFDGTTFRFYTNGVLAASAAGVLGPANSAPLRIGASGDCASFAGQLDEVQLYNRALSLPEIQAIYAAGSAGVCKAILAIANANASQVAVSWPSGASGYLLQSVTNFPASANNWITVTDTPVVVDGRFTVTNNSSGQSKFYRLIH